MTPRKRGLTYEQHFAFGLELARMRDRLTTLTAPISNAYSNSSKAMRHIDIAVQRIDLARFELENRLLAEYPDDFDTHIYYPSPDQRQEQDKQT